MTLGFPWKLLPEGKKLKINLSLKKQQKTSDKQQGRFDTGLKEEASVLT